MTRRAEKVHLPVAYGCPYKTDQRSIQGFLQLNRHIPPQLCEPHATRAVARLLCPAVFPVQACPIHRLPLVLHMVSGTGSALSEIITADQIIMVSSLGLQGT